MSLNTALDFFISNVTLFIGAFFVVILFLFAVSMYLNLKEEEVHEAEKADLKGLEETLRKVISTTPGAQAESGSNVAAGANPAEVKKLKKELNIREKELAELRNSFEEAKRSFEEKLSETPEKSGSGGGETAGPLMDTELQKKVEDLEARLAEYEIIEDDIANLSVYKEENAKLKAEIDKLKGGSSSVDSGDASEEQAQTATAPSTEPPMNPTGGAPEEASNDIMTEFAEAVGGDLGESKEEPAPKVEAAPEAAPVAQKDTDEKGTDEKSVVQKDEPSAVEAKEAPKDEEASDGSGEEAVFGALDTEKLVEEATSLEGVVDDDDDDDDEDVGQKLISEFEDFVKKDGGV